MKTKAVNLRFELKFENEQLDSKPVTLKVEDEGVTKFYAEFTDYDINNCSSITVENVIPNLTFSPINKDDLPTAFVTDEKGNVVGYGTFKEVAEALSLFLKNFKDYEVEVICNGDTIDRIIQLLKR